jgi:hypothetical protein
MRSTTNGDVKDINVVQKEVHQLYMRALIEPLTSPAEMLRMANIMARLEIAQKHLADIITGIGQGITLEQPTDAILRVAHREITDIILELEGIRCETV